MGTYQLTGREKEVYNMLVENYTSDEILDRLCISMATLKTHANRIYQKKCVCGRIELVVNYYKELLKDAFKNSF